MKRAYYSNTIANFQCATHDEIIGQLTMGSYGSVDQTQTRAWRQEIDILQKSLAPYNGHVYFEYDIPRIGRRIDVVLLIGPVIFVLEFKIGEKVFSSAAVDQVCDYALDLKNFHESSHSQFIAPILIVTEAKPVDPIAVQMPHTDKLLLPIKTNGEHLKPVIDHVISFADGEQIDPFQWERGRYCPTPTIIEAAMALYNNHSVADITRKGADELNLTLTTDAISEIIQNSREKSYKSICFVTGVPGAGKTLVGLDIATKHINKEDNLYSVFLSGNGPLVDILREALARDKVNRGKSEGNRIKKGEALREVKMFIQNVHHFRDDCLRNPQPPIEHVALFDEAQRAWNLDQTSAFMRRKKKFLHFNSSEPEFLLSCLDRHPDWAVVVCLVGGGQEINTGEAGIGEWIDSLIRSYPHWHIHISSRLTDSEYAAGKALQKLGQRKNVTYNNALHLSVSMRSFRAKNVSLLVKQLLDLETSAARSTHDEVKANYPVVLTRDLNRAKQWLRERARGTERYGIVVSSQAERLKPCSINVRAPMAYVKWFLEGKDDVRSSYYLEDVATEFHVQGLELDWACVTWDADFRYSQNGWEHWSFRGSRWQRINKTDRQIYQKNAYRVLLIRARQGMVIVVPNGDSHDPTRNPEFYDATYEYLKGIGFTVI